MVDLFHEWLNEYRIKTPYNESMSLACQFARCEDCPDAPGTFEDDDLMCTCVCHIPDDSDAEH